MLKMKPHEIGPRDGVGGYDDRPIVALVPARSTHAAAVRDAATAMGARFQLLNPNTAEDLRGKLLVVDVTVADAGPDINTDAVTLSPSVIAISEGLGLACYTCVRPTDLAEALPNALRNLSERQTLMAQVQAERQTVRSLNEIGYALSAYGSREELLDTVLSAARTALCADSGSIYLVTEDRELAFVCAQNDTVVFEAAEFVLPMNDHSLAGYVATRGTVLNIPDTDAIDASAPYRINRSFDEAHGYMTTSVLNVPMNDRDGRITGVLALMNHKSQPGVPIRDWDEVRPFSATHADVALSIGSQAAVVIENFRLFSEIQTLFDGFVEAAVNAIEARDPTTGGHSERVAVLTTRLAQAADTSADGPFADISFGARELTELRYAAVLHDFGKVGVSEQVLLKADRLYPWELDQVIARFRVAGLQMLVAHAEENPGELDSIRPRLAELEVDLQRVQELNRPRNKIGDVQRAELEAIAARWRLEDVGEPVIRREQMARLCIPYGTLDPAERLEIESHVTHTYNFLKLIPWTRDLKRVPELAFAHHEKVDGTGYPRGLVGDAIPVGSKLMSIGDIFDALTAADRPYKGRMSIEKAVSILRDEAERGHLWSDAVELFAARELWTGVVVP